LELGELDLSLLGLVVTLTPVDAPSITLDITADSSEREASLSGDQRRPRRDDSADGEAPQAQRRRA
jgi:hypothetical protein